MTYTIISISCIAIMLGIVIYLMSKFFKSKWAEKIEFIKTFKKGKCAIIYIVAIPLFLIAALYSGKSISASIFDAITKAVQLIVLKYDISIALMKESIAFSVAIYMCFSLVIINAMMITVSFLHQNIWNEYRICRFRKGSRNKCIILGNNLNSFYIYNSCKCQNIIVDVLSKDAQEKLYISGTTYKSFTNTSRLSSWLDKYINSFIKKSVSAKNKIDIILNNDNEKTNLSICGWFVNFVNSFDDNIVECIDIYVFGDRKFENIYSQYEEKSKGCLHYVNEYDQIAIDFIDKYPLTQFMNREQIDYETSLIHNDIDINVSMIGFGKTNQQIFLSMVANNQFLTNDSNGKIKTKAVSYHLFDKFYTNNNKSQNHICFKYEYDYNANGGIKENENLYLPLPEMPAICNYHNVNINNIDFSYDLKDAISQNKNSINYIIISLGDDYLSIDIANKIVAKIKEWKMDNCKVFVHIRDKKISKEAAIFLDTNFCHSFGTNIDVAYDYSHIIQEKFSEMAIMRNFVYDIERDMKHDIVSSEEMKSSRIKWFVKRSAIERDSNIYACLSIKSKLHLMGLDYCKKSNEKASALSETEYLSIYAKNDMPNIVKNDDGSTKAIEYSLDFKDSRRKTMAIQEHNRWNAYMITKGFVPSTKDEILNCKKDDGTYSNGKNYSMRLHGNLTTFDGLIEFRKIISNRDKTLETLNDVIKYDYQLLDGAWWILNQNGFKIIEKEGKNR